MSCKGSECCEVSFMRCGRIWNNVSIGVARYITPSLSISATRDNT